MFLDEYQTFPIAGIATDVLNPSQDTQSKHEEGSSEDECSVCERMTTRRCPSCNKHSLCSMRCDEKFDYPPHTMSCPSTRRSLDSTDYLCLAVLKDELPDDPQVCEDFGFSCFWDSMDRRRLFGLYVGLIKHLEVKSRSVAEWLKEGTLHDNIVREYETLPQQSRGGYYPWFLENRHIIEKGVDQQDLLSRWFKKILPYLDPDDKSNDVRNWHPIEKKQGYLMFLCALNSSHPSIKQDEWYLFGFCTTVEIHIEGRLGALYVELIQQCRFTEFWQAFAQGKLIALMDRKGFRERRRPFKYLEAFLSSTPEGENRYSIWDLVRFCRSEEWEAPQHLLVDYGFFNCDTALDRMQLKDTYKELLQKCDPLDLHKACIKGKLFEFANRYMKLEKRFQRLMRNPYPLTKLE